MEDGQKLIKIEIIIDRDLSKSGVKGVSELPTKIFDILNHNGFITKDVSCHEAEVYRRYGLGIQTFGNGHCSSEKNWYNDEPEEAEE